MRDGGWAGVVVVWIVMGAHALLIRLKLLAYAVPGGAGRVGQ